MLIAIIVLGTLLVSLAYVAGYLAVYGVRIFNNCERAGGFLNLWY